MDSENNINEITEENNINENNINEIKENNTNIRRWKKENYIVCFFIGLLVGILIIIIYLAILYYTRSGIFYSIPRDDGICKIDDFVNNPEDVIKYLPHHKMDEILFVKNGKLHFQRPVRNGSCDAKFNIIVIDKPKYCLLSETGQQLLKKIQDLDDDTALYENMQTGETLELKTHCRSDNRNTFVTNYFE